MSGKLVIPPQYGEHPCAYFFFHEGLVAVMNSNGKEPLDQIDKGLSFPPPRNVPALEDFQLRFTRFDDGWRLNR
jgi:hypothetical protein